MGSIKGISCRLFWIMISLCILSLFVFRGISFAEAPDIKITEPQDGTTVFPGEEISVTVESVGGFELEAGMVSIPHGFHEKFTTLPATFTIPVPIESVGTVLIHILGRDISGNFETDEVTLNVQQTATLQSLEINPDDWEFETDWNGNVGKNQYVDINVEGVYSDGIVRDVTHFDTIYVSNNPAIVSVDGNRIIPHKLGQATIMVSNSGVQANIPIIVRKPRGLPRDETIPPTVQVNIQPPANEADWHNSNIIITLTAMDNEGGSGIKEISYQFPYLSAKPTYVEGNHVAIPFSEEGINMFRYVAYDNERNSSGQQVTEFRLDKTPPVTTAVISPPPDTDGYIRSLPVKVTFTATDNLSGVAFTTPERVFTQPGSYQVEYYSRDVAGNVEEPKALTINIAIQDTTPPTISLKLIPIKLKLPLPERIKFLFAHFYKLIYSATDEASGVKEIKAGLVMPDISNFKTKLIRGRQLGVTLNEKLNLLVIYAPNPESVLKQIKEGLFLIQNNQPLHLQLRPKLSVWTIVQTDKFLLISAPDIIFKAIATDNAGNTATKQLEYRGKSLR